MSVGLYDKALSDTIKSWTKQSDIQILKPDETTRLFQILADQKLDKPLTLPIIALSRNRDIEILEMTKQPKTFDGYRISGNVKTSLTFNAIPIGIGYQIDIYAKKIEDADNIMREMVFKIVNNPRLVVDIPYNNCNMKHNCNMYLNSTISDNSDINEHLFPDEFVRFTLKIEIDDAYLFSAPIVKNTILQSAEINIVDKDTHEIIESNEYLINKQ